MTLYEPWISIGLHVYTRSAPRSESYFGSHKGWIFIFVTIQIWPVLLIGWSKFSRQPRQCFIGERISPPTIQRQTHLVSDVTIILASHNSYEREDSGNEIVAVLFVRLGSNYLDFCNSFRKQIDTIWEKHRQLRVFPTGVEIMTIWLLA